MIVFLNYVTQLGLHIVLSALHLLQVFPVFRGEECEDVRV